MALTPKQELELIQLEQEQRRRAKSASAPQDDIQARLDAQIAKDYPRSMSKADKVGAGMALEGGGGAVGQAVGALPMLSGPTLGLSVPVGGFIGGAGGNALSQLRQRASGERPGFSVSEAMGAGVASMVPGAPMAKAGIKAVAKEGVKQGAANLAGMAVETYGENKQLPNVGQAMMAVGGGVAGAGIGRAMDTGASVIKATRHEIDNAVRDQTLAAARQAGYKIAPSQLSDAPAVARALEWLAGGPQTVAATEATARSVNLALARKAIGLAENDVVNLPALKAIRDAQGAVYGDVASVSSKAADALQGFKEARDRSRAFWLEHDRNGTVAASDAAKEWDKKMEGFKSALDQELKDKGRADLIPAFQKARETIAKTHLIEDAFNEGSGSVMADIIAKRRKSGKTITTDELEIIANFAEATGITGKPKRVAAVAHPLAAFTAANSGLYFGGPGQALAAGGAAVAAPMLAKTLLMSNPVQNAMMAPRYGSAMPMDIGAAMGSLSAMAGGREMARDPNQRPVPYR